MYWMNGHLHFHSEFQAVLELFPRKSLFLYIEAKACVPQMHVLKPYSVHPVVELGCWTFSWCLDHEDRPFLSKSTLIKVTR